MRTILVTRRMPGAPWDDLAARFRAGDPPPEWTMPREEFLARARGASGILCTLADRVDAELMEAMGRLAPENLLAVLDGREPPSPVN